MTKAKHSKARPTPWYERFHWQALTITALLMVAYANSIHTSFHFDDFDMLRNAHVTQPGWGLDLFRWEQTRPLTYLTFHWNYLAGNNDPAGYHWVNVLLHAANSVLVLAIARRFLPAVAAFGTAAWFGLHPLQTEAVTYVFARSTLLSTFFALWTIWFYLRDRWTASAGMFALSLLAKEETIALPVLLLLLDLYERKRPRVGYYTGLAAIAAVAGARLLYDVVHARGDTGMGRASGMSAATYLFSEGRVLWTYLRLYILPVGLNLDHDVPLERNPVAWVALAVVLSALAWLAWRRQPAALWALGFFILIAPSSSVVPQADLLFEHRTYFPLIGLTMATGFLMMRLPRPGLAAVLALLIPAMTYATAARNATWRDEKTLWTDVLAKSPGKARAYVALALISMNDDPEASRALLRRGLEMTSGNAELETNYGAAMLAARQPGEALRYFQMALQTGGENADKWNNVGAAYFSLNQMDRAIASFRHALEMDPCHAGARRNLTLAGGVAPVSCRDQVH